MSTFELVLFNIYYLTTLSLSRLFSFDDGVINENGTAGGMRTGRGKQKYCNNNTCPIATLSTTHPICLELGSNPDLCGFKSTTNHLIYGMAISVFSDSGLVSDFDDEHSRSITRDIHLMQSWYEMLASYQILYLYLLTQTYSIQEVLGRTNRLLSLDTTRTAHKKT
jgi:hypothetical protein